jgi:hypothetical protein
MTDTLNNGDILTQTPLQKVLMASGLAKYGANADKAASPVVGSIYITTDTNTLYTCSVAGVWTAHVATPQGNPASLKVITTEVVIASTTDETNFVSYTVPANTLGTANLIRGEVVISLANNSGTSNDFTVNVKYGGTTVCAFRKFVNASAASTYKLIYRFWIKGNGATNAQQGQASAVVWGTEGADGSGATINAPAIATATIDSTAAQTLLITGKHSFSNAATTATMRLATLECMAAL